MRRDYASLAGLFTVDLPPAIVKGQEFSIVVRRSSSRRLDVAPPPDVDQNSILL
jgi:hypothetical protein